MHAMAWLTSDIAKFEKLEDAKRRISEQERAIRNPGWGADTLIRNLAGENLGMKKLPWRTKITMKSG
jgi:hypothetical protein